LVLMLIFIRPSRVAICLYDFRIMAVRVRIAGGLVAVVSGFGCYGDRFI